MPVSTERLKTYQESLAQYHLHPEAKFHNGDYLKSGVTVRRHITPASTHYIGKEANRWEEQNHLGMDQDAQVEYGMASDEGERLLEAVIEAASKFGQKRLAEVTGISVGEVRAIVGEKRKPLPGALCKLHRAAGELEEAERERTKLTEALLEAVRKTCGEIGVRELARRASVDAGNMTAVLVGRRRLSRAVTAKLTRVVGGIEDW